MVLAQIKGQQKGPQKMVIFEKKKNVVYLAHFQFDPTPILALYQGVEKLQMQKSRLFISQKNAIKKRVTSNKR